MQTLVCPCSWEAVEQLGKFVVAPHWGGLVHVANVVHQGQPALFQEQHRAYVSAKFTGVGHFVRQLMSCASQLGWEEGLRYGPEPAWVVECLYECFCSTVRVVREQGGDPRAAS